MLLCWLYAGSGRRASHLAASVSCRGSDTLSGRKPVSTKLSHHFSLFELAAWVHSGSALSSCVWQHFWRSINSPKAGFTELWDHKLIVWAYSDKKAGSYWVAVFTRFQNTHTQSTFLLKNNFLLHEKKHPQNSYLTNKPCPNTENPWIKGSYVTFDTLPQMKPFV